MPEKSTRKRWIKPLIILSVLGCIVSIGVAIFFSKIKGDKQVLDDIDLHFSAVDQAPTLPQTESEMPRVEALSIATSNIVRAKTSPPKQTKQKRRYRRKKRENAPNAASSQKRAWPGIRNVGPATYEINITLAESARKNPMKFVPGVFASLQERNGAPIGFQLQGIRPKSALFSLGLKNNDVLTAVNGFSLKSVDDALPAVGAAKFADRLRVDILRNGRPKSLYYRIITF